MSDSPRPMVEELEEQVCWDLLSDSDVGRLAVSTDDGVDIFPVNFLAKDRVLYFRSAAGSKLMDLTMHPAVAFQVEGTHRRARWSVVVKGRAERMALDSEIEASGVLGLHTLSPTEKWNYVRILPGAVTGRRFIGPRRSVKEMAKAIYGG